VAIYEDDNDDDDTVRGNGGAFGWTFLKLFGSCISISYSKVALVRSIKAGNYQHQQALINNCFEKIQQEQDALKKRAEQVTAKNMADALARGRPTKRIKSRQIVSKKVSSRKLLRMLALRYKRSTKLTF
jgi:hypothetical protein